jgi:hypothetical protein
VAAVFCAVAVELAELCRVAIVYGVCMCMFLRVFEFAASHAYEVFVRVVGVLQCLL